MRITLLVHLLSEQMQFFCCCISHSPRKTNTYFFALNLALTMHTHTHTLDSTHTQNVLILTNQHTHSTAHMHTDATHPFTLTTYTAATVLSIPLPRHFTPTYMYIATSITSYRYTSTRYWYSLYIAMLFLLVIIMRYSLCIYSFVSLFVSHNEIREGTLDRSLAIHVFVCTVC